MQLRWRGHAIVSLITAAVFSRALPYPLQAHWDDGRFIIDNPDVHEVSRRAFESIVGGPHFEAYHPLHLLSYWLDVPWFGASGPAQHAMSLGLWLVAANLVLRVCLQLGLSTAAATIAALACVVHPAQVEAVSWATGRKDVLALLFSSLCILWHLRSERFADRFAWLSRTAFALGALSKTTVLPLPGVLVLADILIRRRPARTALAQQLPSLLLSAGLGMLVMILWRTDQMIRPSPDGAVSIVTRVAATFAHQLGTAFWPASNAPMYSTAPMAWPIGFAWLVCLAAPMMVYAAVRMRARRALFASSAFALLMLPVSNVVPMYFSLQDRYLSLPLLALAVGLGAALDALSGQKRARRPFAIGALLVSALCLRTFQYEGEWQSELRLWSHAAKTQSNAYYAYLKLGEVRRRSGDLHGAVRAYKELLRIEPLRKTGYAALFEAVALRDESIHRIAPSRADALAENYFNALEDPEELRAFALQLLGTGYMRTFELPMARSLALRPVPDSALSDAAALYFKRGMPTVGLFYAQQMEHPNDNPALAAAAERTRKKMAHSPL
jgi:hypothetical protein